MEKRTPSFKGLRPLFQIATSVTKKSCAKHEGFLASLLLDWPLIVGADLSRKAHPKKISFPRGQNKGGSVTLAVSSGTDSMIVYHMNPTILDKINTFFGYAAFHQIKVVQTKDMGFIKKTSSSPEKSVLSEKNQNQITDLTKDLPDSPLKDALERLGKGLYLKDQSHDK
jgi:hypothetical protein